MRNRLRPSAFALVALLTLCLAAGCKGEPEVESPAPPPVSSAPPPPAASSAPTLQQQQAEAGFRMNPILLGASRTVRLGDAQGGRQQYEALLEQARTSGDADLERGARLGLARTGACLGDKEEPGRIYGELWQDAAAGEPRLTLFWDALATGLTYSALENTAEAREAFQRAVRILDDVPEKQPWFEAAQLFPRWMLARAGDTAAAAEARQGVQALKGNYSGPQLTYLKLERANLQACGWDRQAAGIDEFAKELGFDRTEVWTRPLPGAPPSSR